MSRPLSADERLLWRRVTADVRPAIRRIDDEKLPTAAAPVAKPRIPPTPRPVMPPRHPAHTKPVTATTLDASWDRKLRGGQVEPDRVVDLHGLTRDAAHRRAVDAVAAAVRAGDRIVVLITGRAPAAGTSRVDMPLRGIIRASIADWLAASPVASRIAAVRAAHPRHGGAGAIYVVIRRPRPPGA
ncbi:MAG: Smr/MutS family protein [Sphingomonadales bacterium]